MNRWLIGVSLAIVLVLFFQNCADLDAPTGLQNSSSQSPEPLPEPTPEPAPMPTPQPMPPPMPSDPLTDYQKSSNSGPLTAGLTHTCAIKNGALFCWGNNTNGKLGTGNTSSRTIPTAVSGMETGVQAVAAGESHTCAIKGGALYCWGTGASYRLGTGTTANAAFPQAVFNMNAGVTAVSAGRDHTCAIKDGSLYCWGTSNVGQSGLASAAPQQVPYKVPNFDGVTAVAAGNQHTCAIKGGALYCWGNNSNGQLGLGNTTTTAGRNPTAVQLNPVMGFESDTVAVAASDRTTCARKSNGSLYCWGYNQFGQVGVNSTATSITTPRAVPGFEQKTTHLSANFTHVCAIKDTGLYCWGSNETGQLGQNNRGNTLRSPPPNPVVVLLQTGEQFIHVAAGGQNGSTLYRLSHTCGYTNQNRVLCWGDNNAGQIGDNTTQDKVAPVAIGL